MIAIILAASNTVQAKALRQGFRTQVVLVKHIPGTDEEAKPKGEAECFALKAWQFLVSSSWGMGPE